MPPAGRSPSGAVWLDRSVPLARLRRAPGAGRFGSAPASSQGGTLIVVGIDGHKNTHTLVAVDPLGKRLAVLTVAARPVDHLKALAWLHGYGPVLVAVEDCRHLTRWFEADLLNSGHAVVRVHPRLMAGARRSARERGKSDPIDAEAVARVALREPDLPKACLDGPSRDIKLLVDHRRTLVAQRTAIGNKLRWFLHELDPELAVASRGLRRLCVLDQLAHALMQHRGTLAAIAAELVANFRTKTEALRLLRRRISDRVFRALLADQADLDQPPS
ncbi:transposase [Streptomyces sp. NPDC002701]|uniref:IS110 family transposase n=1 Tax=Streptomyces sp. NPDC002701 TaxID=3364661 RepID=UPI00367F3AAE